LNFAYEEALESQTPGKQLQIPVWIINDYPKELTVKLRCQIQDLSGHIVWNRELDGVVPADGRKEMGIVEWVVPDIPGVYVLRGEATGREGQMQASASTFIKVTPKLFSSPHTVLLIGQRKYSVPIAELIRATGVRVDVIDERSFDELARLRNADELRQKYDVVWLASFDSLWKVLDDGEAEGLKKAVQEGVAFIHSGGRGSFHGGFGEGACLDFTPLADVLPVDVRKGYDLVFGQASARTTMFSEFAAIKDIHPSHREEEWSDGGLK